MLVYRVGNMLLIAHNNYNPDDDSTSPCFVITWIGIAGDVCFAQCDTYDTYKIVEYLANAEFVNAIKHLREISGLGLKEAKDIIDKLRDSFLKINVVKPTRVTIDAFSFK